MAAQSLLLFGGKVSMKQRNTVPGKGSVISLHDKQWRRENVAVYDRNSGPDRWIYAGVLRCPVVPLRFRSAVRTSARRSVMMGQQHVFVHRNWVIDCYITVVPVESGWLLLKEIRVWGKLQNWVSSGMSFFFFSFPETRSSQKSLKFLVIFKTCLCFFVFCFCWASLLCSS